MAGTGQACMNAAIATGAERAGTVVATDITTKVALMIAVAAAITMVATSLSKGSGADKPSAATRDGHLPKEAAAVGGLFASYPCRPRLLRSNEWQRSGISFAVSNLDAGIPSECFQNLSLGRTMKAAFAVSGCD